MGKGGNATPKGDKRQPDLQDDHQARRGPTHRPSWPNTRKYEPNPELDAFLLF